MCIAILNTKGVTLKRELLNNCWQNNGDGAGILYAKDGKMQIFKEMKSFDNFYNNYLDIRNDVSKQNIVLHFRISTHGKINETNCHPFLVNDELGFVHNGMIYDVPRSTDFSDTYMFNECVLKNFAVGFEYNETILDMLDGFINGSKLIFLNANDDFAIVNEKAGHWNMGCWFSNSSYKQVNNWVDFGGKKVKKGSLGTSGTSGTSYNYGNYGWKSWDYDTYSTPGTYSFGEYPDHECKTCAKSLYGINEINRGTCDWCHEEEEYYKNTNTESNKKEDLCDGCLNDIGVFDSNLDSYVCNDCRSFFYDDYVVDSKSNKSIPITKGKGA